MRGYVRSKDRAGEGEEGGVKWFAIGMIFDVFAVCNEGDLFTNRSMIAVGRGQGRIFLDSLF